MENTISWYQENQDGKDELSLTIILSLNYSTVDYHLLRLFTIQRKRAMGQNRQSVWKPIF